MMSQVIKAFLGVFFLLMLTLLGTGIVSAQLDSARARDYKETVVAEIENSECNDAVIAACIQQATEDGYELSVSLYEKDELRTAEICLTYEYKIPMLNYSKKQQIWGYAL